jgi:tellurite resistance protein TerC
VLWFWIGFVAFVLVMLALDLGVFHREAHTVSFKESAVWVSIWVALAVVFGACIPFYHEHGTKAAIEFFTGYILEQSLSMDNVFVIALIFAYFRVPQQYQHRVLFWGIIGVLVMRGAMIGIGAQLINQFHWILYVFGAFLIYTGFKMAFAGEEDDIAPDQNFVVRLVKRFIPVHTQFDGQNFFTRIDGKLFATPLFVVLMIVETTDLIFAVDSIPAIFGVTTDSFIVFTSNVFAVLGLRSLYFLLAGAMGLFRYLKLGLSIVLIFVGVKMLELHHHLLPHDHPVAHFLDEYKHTISLSVIVGVLTISVIASLIAAKHDPHPEASGEEPALPPDSPLVDPTTDPIP